VDNVIHLGAMGSVPMSMDQPMLCNEINVTGTLNMMLTAHAAGIKRFVYASSSAVYGDDELPNKVESSIGRPLSPYAASKFINEVYARTYHAAFGLETVGLRFFNVFGPRQDPKGAYAAVIPCWISAMQQGESVFINGSGENTRDFCFVRDVVQALILASMTTNAEAFGSAFNVGLGSATNLVQLFQTIRTLVQEQSGKPVPDVIHRAARAGDILHSCADTSRVQRVLSFAPEYSVMQGLRITVGL
jgi:UDP-N-acetylglucosamine 4-epimerase